MLLLNLGGMKSERGECIKKEQGTTGTAAGRH